MLPLVLTLLILAALVLTELLIFLTLELARLLVLGQTPVAQITCMGT